MKVTIHRFRCGIYVASPTPQESPPRLESSLLHLCTGCPQASTCLPTVVTETDLSDSALARYRFWLRAQAPVGFIDTQSEQGRG